MELHQAIKQYLLAAPKAELHIHLEGAIRPETLLILARRNNITLPVNNIDEMNKWFTFRNLAHFVNIFFEIMKCLKTSEDYELIAYELGKEMKRQNIRYAEVTFSAGNHHFVQGIEHDVYLTGLNRGRKQAFQDFGVNIRWIFDIIRDVADKEQRNLRADYTTQVAIESKKEGVVALGLGGSEEGFLPEQFSPWFEKALSAGLHSVPHAGETIGPESIWGALQALGAERIGHGVHSIDDSRLVKYLIMHNIPLEVCPSSNLNLNVYPAFKKHPLPLLYKAGIPITINSDDPSLFNTSLTEDIEKLNSEFQLKLDQIDEIILNGVRYSFLSEEQKQDMETRFRNEMAELRKELIP